jgi:hypothetical protein
MSDRPFHCIPVMASLFFWLLVVLPISTVAQAAAPPALVVVRLTVSRPAVLGRYATANCTIKNRSSVPVSVVGLAVVATGSDGHETPFNVNTLAQPLAGPLKPGQEYSIRQFGRMKTAGKYACSVRASDAAGQWAPLLFASGRPAVVPLQVSLEDSVQRARFHIADPNPRHLYRAGDQIRIQVLPVLTGGLDLAPAVKMIMATTPVKPFSMTDTGKAKDLLGATTGRGGDFSADFWGTPNDMRYLNLAVNFTAPVSFSSLTLAGANLNGMYHLDACEITIVTPAGKDVSAPATILQPGSTWTVICGLSADQPAVGVKIRLHTPYKIDVNHLSLEGAPAGGTAEIAGAQISYRWQDGAGRILTGPARLTPFKPNAVISPQALQPGYYGLHVTTRIPGVDDAQDEFGFVVLPAPPAGVIHDPRLGMVHMDLGDPNLGVGWVKTLSAQPQAASVDAAVWLSSIQYRTDRGFTELPIVSGGEWDSDSATPVSLGQLQRLRLAMADYFKADPGAHAWELGLEENLQLRSHRDNWKYFWPNLDAKASAVRQAAADAGVTVELAYQIAEIDLRSVEDFLASPASKQFDVLSLHPYAWPDFPPPEKWMPAYLSQVHELMARYKTSLPIWFTEIGAPQDGNAGGFFGYPDIPAYDRGLSPHEYAGYLVKCHLLAYQLGVQKLFWYHYRDTGDDPEYAEDHFGLVDSRGFPGPGYAAYASMARLLSGLQLEGHTDTKGLRVDHFGDAAKSCYVAWTYPAESRTETLKALGIREAADPRIVGLFGQPVAIQGDKVAVSGDPIYITDRG